MTIMMILKQMILRHSNLGRDTCIYIYICVCVYIYVYMYIFIIYYKFFIYSSIDGHLNSFHAFVLVNSAAVNIGTHVSF